MTKICRNKKHSSYQSGFTLIELLVVISIITLLSSIILTNLNKGRVSSRIANRQSNLSSLRKAMELYYNDNNGYPSTSMQWYNTCGFTGGSNVDVPLDSVIPGLVPTYVAHITPGPQYTGHQLLDCYYYASNGTDYKLIEWQVPDTNPYYNPSIPGITEFMDPLRSQYTIPTDCSETKGPFGYHWAIYSKGAMCW